MSSTDRRRIRWLLAAATVVPTLVLASLGVQIIRQERAAEAQRHHEALSIVAGRLALDIERQLQDLESRLTAGDGIMLGADGPVSSRAWPLLYRASIPTPRDASTPALLAAEMLEQQERHRDEAVAAFRTLTRSRDVAIRAAALLGLGRVLRRQGDRSAALRAYDDLAALGATSWGC